MAESRQGVTDPVRHATNGFAFAYTRRESLNDSYYQPLQQRLALEPPVTTQATADCRGDAGEPIANQEA
jgi:hypothetical protein